jgi:HPt (histidine-containing phosphotransfer) domain-containing protein
MKKNVVHVDPELQEIFPNFLRNKQKEQQALARALENEDFDAIAQLGHKLKGSSEAYGLAELGKLGRAIEKAAASRDKKAISDNVEAMKNYLDNLEVVFDAEAA